MRTKGGGSTVRVPFLGGMSTENKGKRGGLGYMIYWTREAAARRQLIKMVRPHSLASLAYAVPFENRGTIRQTRGWRPSSPHSQGLPLWVCGRLTRPDPYVHSMLALRMRGNREGSTTTTHIGVSCLEVGIKIYRTRTREISQDKDNRAARVSTPGRKSDLIGR